MEHVCEHCNGAYYAPPSQESRFCNRSCYDEFRRGIFNCDECKKTFTHYKSHKRGKHVFCSAKCQKIFQNKHPKNHPNWKHGRASYRKIVEIHLGRKLRSDEIVHHINEDRTDNRIENLEVTNRADHARTHYKNSPYQKGHKPYPRPSYGGK